MSSRRATLCGGSSGAIAKPAGSPKIFTLTHILLFFLKINGTNSKAEVHLSPCVHTQVVGDVLTPCHPLRGLIRSYCEARGIALGESAPPS
jgi:hypothetical protein